MTPAGHPAGPARRRRPLRAVRPAPEPVASAPVDAVDDVSLMVDAAGSLLGWRGARYLLAPTDGVPPVVLRSWGTGDHTGAAEDLQCPAWVASLDPDAWHDRRVATRTGPDVPAADAAVVVPVRHEDAVVGMLAFLGPDLAEPDEPRLHLLEAIATVLGRSNAAAIAAGPHHASALERAIALVDVFAFTVRVGPGGAVEWLYFGPNSAAVFGQPVSDAEPLPALMRRHVHAEDLVPTNDFLNAVATGRRMEIEVRLHGVDGTSRWVSWRVVPRRVDGALLVDGVATDVSARHSLGRSRHELAEAQEQYSRELDVRRSHALAVRDANDNVLQRLFAAGLRLQMLQRKLNDVEAHAASAIAFQLDQAATDLRELILNLNEFIEGPAEPSSPPGPPAGS